jgi:hypothetical protein
MPQEVKDFTSLFALTPNISILDLNVEFDDITQILNTLIIGKKMHMWGMD